MKRDNWTNKEIIEILRGFLITENNSVRNYVQWHNWAIEDAIDEFASFDLPIDVPGALAMIEDTKEIVHVGGLLPQVEISDENTL